MIVNDIFFFKHVIDQAIHVIFMQINKPSVLIITHVNTKVLSLILLLSSQSHRTILNEIAYIGINSNERLYSI